MSSTAHRLALAGAIGAALTLGAVTSCSPGESAPAPTPAPAVRTVTATATVTVGHAVATATATATVPVPCEEEDGSTPGQAFPCRWDAARQGNGRGESFTLTAPAG